MNETLLCRYDSETSFLEILQAVDPQTSRVGIIFRETSHDGLEVWQVVSFDSNAMSLVNWILRIWGFSSNSSI